MRKIISLRLAMNLMEFNWNTKKELLGMKGKGFVSKVAKKEIEPINEKTLKNLRKSIQKGDYTIC